MKMTYSLRYLFITTALIAVVLTVYDRLQVERHKHCLQGQYLLAIAKIQLLEEILDESKPQWRTEHQVPAKLDNLPAPEKSIPISAAALP